MAKIGRNEKCPCGSGKKFKHCCSNNPKAQPRPSTPDEQLKISLMDAVHDVCHAAMEKKQMIRELGVFVLLATAKGNGWLFEVTQSDCVQLVNHCEMLPVPIDEDPQTIEIEWGHTYTIIDKQMRLTAYKDHSQSVLEDCPLKEVSASIRRIKKKIPPDMLEKIHIAKEAPLN